jgi:hypothetical protein
LFPQRFGPRERLVIILRLLSTDHKSKEEGRVAKNEITSNQKMRGLFYQKRDNCVRREDRERKSEKRDFITTFQSAKQAKLGETSLT